MTTTATTTADGDQNVLALEAAERSETMVCALLLDGDHGVGVVVGEIGQVEAAAQQREEDGRRLFAHRYFHYHIRGRRRCARRLIDTLVLTFQQCCGC